MNKISYRFFSIVACLLFSNSGFANLPLPVSHFSASAIFLLEPGSGTDDYRIGSEWGKIAVTQEHLNNKGDVFKRAVLATAQYGYGGTAFYLGKFAGYHVMATNFHVMDAIPCGGRSKSRFPYAGKSFACMRSFGKWTDIDLSLYAIKVPVADETVLAGTGRNFNWNTPVYTGQELLTVGYGSAGNPDGRTLMANDDSDCKVFSATNDFRFMDDPDQVNPGKYKAWSFANGCDVSHGDSGSSFIDRKTGDIIGIVWTGKVPKNSKIKDSAFLSELIKKGGEEIWTELTYSVPAQKIRDKLTELAGSGTLEKESQKVIEAVLKNAAE
ncbi:MAG: hypothetical protein A2583_15360 [Bdellovibrionales bacterium RIFOXYD1_FULL_53_11]|nr:MAG: hypothetical protein A2583_15360 [Bdellovibrionales bacterium RIFOXYD1_FULL_53_11]